MSDILVTTGESDAIESLALRARIRTKSSTDFEGKPSGVSWPWPSELECEDHAKPSIHNLLFRTQMLAQHHGRIRLMRIKLSTILQRSNGETSLFRVQGKANVTNTRFQCYFHTTCKVHDEMKCYWVRLDDWTFPVVAPR